VGGDLYVPAYLCARLLYRIVGSPARFEVSKASFCPTQDVVPLYSRLHGGCTKLDC
jgi:hypothetical protein